jgi:hypothetical protein
VTLLDTTNNDKLKCLLTVIFRHKKLMFYRYKVSTAEFISSARNWESVMFHFLLMVKKMMDNVQMNVCGS